MSADSSAEKRRFVERHYDQDDEAFYAALRLTGWLADPIIQEVARRLKKLPEKNLHLYADLVMSVGCLTKENNQLREFLREANADSFAVEDAYRKAHGQRPGPKSEYQQFAYQLLREYGSMQKSELVDALAQHWPDRNRRSLSNAICNAVKHKTFRVNKDLISLPPI